MPRLPLRSTHGCWTCRVRHKKCDETHPVCKLCQSLHITCHGYSIDQPEWMDNGDKEKAVVENLKRSVRLTTRRRKPLQTKMPSTSHSSFSMNLLESVSHEDRVREQGDKHSNASLVINKPFLEICPYYQEREPGLIMHFFDHVFPLQYPGYRPIIEEGGRGWYLSLIFSNRILYHAVLCLGAYHRETTMLLMGTTSQKHNAQDLEIHNSLSFKVLQQQLQDDTKSMGLKDRIGMLAGIIQMMFFQVSIDMPMISKSGPVIVRDLCANQS